MLWSGVGDVCMRKMWERRGGQGRSHNEACVCPAVRRAGCGERFGIHYFNWFYVLLCMKFQFCHYPIFLHYYGLHYF